MLGSGSSGGTSAIGLSVSFSGLSASCSIEEYSLLWMFQRTGTRGSTGGRSKDGEGGNRGDTRWNGLVEYRCNTEWCLHAKFRDVPR